MLLVQPGLKARARMVTGDPCPDRVVHHDGRGFLAPIYPNGKGPGHLEPFDVLGIDLIVLVMLLNNTPPYLEPSGQPSESSVQITLTPPRPGKRTGPCRSQRPPPLPGAGASA